MPKTLARSFRLVCPPEAIPKVEALLRAQGYDFEPEPFSPWCRRLVDEPRPLGGSLAAFFGYIYIQDRSSMRASGLCGLLLRRRSSRKLCGLRASQAS